MDQKKNIKSPFKRILFAVFLIVGLFLSIVFLGFPVKPQTVNADTINVTRGYLESNGTVVVNTNTPGSGTYQLLPNKIYFFEVGGAQGGMGYNVPGAFGGYSYGYYDTRNNESQVTIYYHVGGKGEDSVDGPALGGYNGGGTGGYGQQVLFPQGGGGGGGASDIRIGGNDLEHRIIVAGGGGGGGSDQAALPTPGGGDIEATGALGIGDDGFEGTTQLCGGGGGGGGYYGGAGGSYQGKLNNSHSEGGKGGSGYIGGVVSILDSSAGTYSFVNTGNGTVKITEYSPAPSVISFNINGGIGETPDSIVDIMWLGAPISPEYKPDASQIRHPDSYHHNNNWYTRSGNPGEYVYTPYIFGTTTLDSANVELFLPWFDYYYLNNYFITKDGDAYTVFLKAEDGIAYIPNGTLVTIQEAIDAIKVATNNNHCMITFGDGQTLDIGSDNIIFDDFGVNYDLEIFGKITSSHNVDNSGVIILTNGTKVFSYVNVTATGESSSLSVIRHNGNGKIRVHGGTLINYGNGYGIYNSANGLVSIAGSVLVRAKPSSGGTIFVNNLTTGAEALEIKEGTIENNGTGAAICNNSHYDVNITGGEIISYGGYAIHNMSRGTINISGQETYIYSNHPSYTIFLSQPVEYTGPRLNMTGGVVENGGSGSAIYNATSGEVAIFGGSVISTSTGPAINNILNGKILIGGNDTLISSNSAATATIRIKDFLTSTDVRLEISGGTITNSSTGFTILNESTGEVFIFGGTVTTSTINRESTIKNASSGKLTIHNSAIIENMNGKNAIVNSFTGVVTILGGEIRSAGVPIYVGGNSELNISGGKIISENSSGISLRENVTVNMSGGEIEALNSSGITSYRTNTINMTGGVINALLGINTDGYININYSTVINATNIGILQDLEGEILLFDCSISGGVAAIDAVNSTIMLGWTPVITGKIKTGIGKLTTSTVSNSYFEPEDNIYYVEIVNGVNDSVAVNSGERYFSNIRLVNEGYFLKISGDDILIADIITISYNLNGGVGFTPDKQLIAKGTNTTIPEYGEWTKEGYLTDNSTENVNWFTRSGIEGDYTYTLFDFSTNVLEDTELFLKWNPAIVTIDTNSPLENGTFNSPYSKQIVASIENNAGGTLVYGVVVDEGDLPLGLSVNFETGVIYGTPREIGTFTFLIGATNLSSMSTGTKEFTLTINPLDVLEKDDEGDKITIEAISDHSYTGSQIKPEPKVYYDQNELVKGTDYEYTYGENINFGNDNGLVNIIFIGNYSGSRTVLFNIKKAWILDVLITGGEWIYNGESRTVDVIARDDDQITYSLNREGPYESLKPTFTNVGTYVVYFKVNRYGHDELWDYEYIIINKATPTVPAESFEPMEYSPTRKLSDLLFSEEGWSWVNPNINPTVKVSSYHATYTPSDTNNYNEITVNISLTITKATPTVETPTFLEMVYLKTRKLSDLVFSEEGWSWSDPNITPTVKNNVFNATYTPSDIDNYNTITVPITLNITKAAPPDYSTKNPVVNADLNDKTGDIELPNGWVWDNEDEMINENGNKIHIDVDDENYDYTNVEGYDKDLHKVSRVITVILNRNDKKFFRYFMGVGSGALLSIGVGILYLVIRINKEKKIMDNYIKGKKNKETESKDSK